MMIKSNIEKELCGLLLEKKYETILEFLKNPENERLLRRKVWRLINKICLTVKTNKILEHESDIVLCKKILLHVAAHGNPREVLIFLMEEADCFKEHSFFCLLLDPLKETLNKLPTKRGKSLEWILDSLNAHIELLPAPRNYDLEGEEKLLLDAIPEVVEANYILSNYFTFVDFFVDEVSCEKEDTGPINGYLRRVLQEYILKLFHRPFLYHDLHVADEAKPKSTIRKLCENYIKSLCKMTRNIFSLYKYDQFCPVRTKASLLEDKEPVPLLAFSNLSYLLFVEKLALDFQPFLYTHVHIFLYNVKYITQSLSERDNFALFKGLMLAEVLLDRLEDLEISHRCIKMSSSVELSRLLLNVAIHCQQKELRQRSVQIFMSYLNKCDTTARYHLILHVVCTIDHSGCVGLAIDLYKKFLHDSFDNPDSYFLGKNLGLFLKRIFVLTDGVATDLLENSDRIVATLNFLRYLVLRDKREVNRTGIWDLVTGISETYIKLLSTAIDVSRAHYKETAREAIEGKKRKNIVTVNNTVMPLVAWKGIYDKALLSFDVLESIISRIREIIE